MFLIIGGSGFIGTNFANFLIENNYNFKIYDKKKSKFLPKNIDIILGDIRDKTKLSNSMKGCEIVFHLATVPPSLKLSNQEIYDIDINGTKNVFTAAEKNNVKKVIFTSSASHVYGLIDKGLYPIQENCNLNPINEYGKNKVISEELCKKATETTELQTIVLRLSMVLGAYNFDPILMENIKILLKNKRVIIAGDGKSKNQSIYVKDVITALMASAESSKKSIGKFEVFNISGREILTINEWIDLTKQVCNSNSKTTHIPLSLAKSICHMAWRMGRTKVHPSYIDLMAHDQFFDIGRAKRTIGWEPRYDTKDALTDTIKFFKNEC